MVLVLCLFGACNRTPPVSVSLPQPQAKTPEQIWKEIAPSLIFVSAEGLDGSTMIGSGFVSLVDGKRYVLTNRHVVKGAFKVWVGTDTSTLVAARSYKISPDLDLALLDCPAELTAPPLQLTQTIPNPGSEVMAFGFPLGLGKVITRGIVSAVEEDYVLFDAPISSGNSGGPLVNAEGKVIGVATMGARNDGITVVQNLNVGIRSSAIPTLELFREPLLRLRDLANEIKSVEHFIEQGYRDDAWFALGELLQCNCIIEHMVRTEPDKLRERSSSSEAQKAKKELQAAHQRIEALYGSIRRAVEKYVSFLKECEQRIDALPDAFAGLGSDPLLAQFLKDERVGASVRVRATAPLLPRLARTSADHWLSRFEDHRFRVQWTLAHSKETPALPLLSEIEAQEKLIGHTERPSIRITLNLTGDRQADLKDYFLSLSEWSSRKDVLEDRTHSVFEQQKATSDPIHAQMLHGDLLSQISSFQQYLGIARAEKGDLVGAANLFRDEAESRTSSSWSRALLAQHLAYAGKFDEAWTEYGRYLEQPAPFDAFAIRQGWPSVDVALMHITEGYEMEGEGFRKQFGSQPEVVANCRRWNDSVQVVEGVSLRKLRSINDTFTSGWFNTLPRLSKVRVLAYFRQVRPEEGAMAYYQQHRQFPKRDTFRELKEFEAALTKDASAKALWEELNQHKAFPFFL